MLPITSNPCTRKTTRRTATIRPHFYRLHSIWYSASLTPVFSWNFPVIAGTVNHGNGGCYAQTVSLGNVLFRMHARSFVIRFADGPTIGGRMRYSELKKLLDSLTPEQLDYAVAVYDPCIGDF